MKKIIYGVIVILGLNILTTSCFIDPCFAGFGDDPLDLVPGITGVIRTDEGPSSALLDTIKSTINWILGILATIALVFCLYAGFKMLTSGGDSKTYEAGRGILKNASIGLAIIGLSWLIVSAVIRFVKLQGGEGAM